MKLLKALIILLILLLLPYSLKLKGQDFGQSRSLFTDVKANRVGDLLTVLIYENNTAQQNAQTKTEKSTEASTSGGPGVGSLDFIKLFGADAKNESTFDGKGSNSRNGSLRARMSVTVVEVRANGDLVIEGSRTIGINGERETLHLAGVVRQKDVTPQNTVDSYLIGDAEIHYTGKGSLNSGTRPGIFTRIINWLF
ncbi:MAG TPA: flagellar basal body L-ring protein FlgH [candidate division Zixibacteria bacterium]|nr:flagellar basal body L-ring protein FlgH [candidate division Zixibacteria bacterium]MDD4917156.1 flagellar basal body L-ring protein FlgH [candidate division Zixibacteria bacterium]MDM7972660.1 flagellar basal body L-ring protein FlgH [candidate division Zixibacteria bacterium]HOD65424.1 flagellar basal body L-ring protein FlgH [candidate division Zixibacteria bacterium]HOZ06765.1 flagellar basal body L-ring protein FlgH [candidate division Zixibacteria bacterium]